MLGAWTGAVILILRFREKGDTAFYILVCRGMPGFITNNHASADLLLALIQHADTLGHDGLARFGVVARIQCFLQLMADKQACLA